MKKNLQFKNQTGFTLIELLASIVILSLILLFFINVLLQSAATNNASETIVDATYAAQTEMENIIYSDDSPSSLVCSYPKDQDGYYIDVKLEHMDDNNLYRVIVEVYNGEGTDKRLQAKMENVIELEEVNEEEDC